MYAFQSQSTHYSFLNVKELLTRNRHDMWSVSDSYGTVDFFVNFMCSSTENIFSEIKIITYYFQQNHATSLYLIDPERSVSTCLILTLFCETHEKNIKKCWCYSHTYYFIYNLCAVLFYLQFCTFIPHTFISS